MGFSQAQYEAVVNKVVEGGNKLSSKISEIGPAANKAMGHWYIPQFIKDLIKWLAEKITQLAKWILDKIIDLLKGAVAPVRMFMDAYQWQTIRGLAGGVSGQLKDTALTVDDVWTGPARDEYVKTMKPHSDAADRIGKISDKASVSLNVCAAAGAAFYLALAVIAFKSIVGTTAATAAISSGVLAPAGAAGQVASTTVTAGEIVAAVTTLTALLGAQASQMSVLHGEAVDPNMFPGGHWPDPSTGKYSDATVKDGDADWSLKKA